MIIDVESCLDYTCCLSTIKIHWEQVEAQTNILESDCRHGSKWWDFVLLSIWLDALASEITSSAFMWFVPQHALEWQKQKNPWIC